mmetsp:Transcript_2308/g.4278  ORF Transcript_2308/g.4278 Transcript_2308/m.4278 type:complete len:236 (-) Transcript_2308:950-1657(-)
MASAPRPPPKRDASLNISLSSISQAYLSQSTAHLCGLKLWLSGSCCAATERREGGGMDIVSTGREGSGWRGEGGCMLFRTVERVRSSWEVSSSKLYTASSSLYKPSLTARLSALSLHIAASTQVGKWSRMNSLPLTSRTAWKRRRGAEVGGGAGEADDDDDDEGGREEGDTYTSRTPLVKGTGGSLMTLGTSGAFSTGLSPALKADRNGLEESAAVRVDLGLEAGRDDAFFTSPL